MIVLLFPGIEEPWRESFRFYSQNTGKFYNSVYLSRNLFDKSKNEDWVEHYFDVAEYLSKQNCIVFIEICTGLNWHYARERIKNSEEEKATIFPSLESKEEWIKRLEYLNHKDREFVSSNYNFLVRQLSFLSSYDVHAFDKSYCINDYKFHRKAYKEDMENGGLLHGILREFFK